MQAQIDDSMHWSEHYVEHGFAVIPNAVEPHWIEQAQEEVARVLDTSLPQREWNSATVPALQSHLLHLPFDAARMKFLLTVYDQPGVRAVLQTMFGPQHLSEERTFQIFVTSFDANATASLGPHLDFLNGPIPILGSGFMFQLALWDSEVNGGNLLVYPGTHKRVLKALIENPDRQFPRDLEDLLHVEPYEFVANAGDLVIFHHLVGHSGSFNRAAGRTPRVVLHGQGTRNEWLTEIDVTRPDLSPWERGLAVSGSYRDTRGEKQIMLDHWRLKREM